MKNSKKVVAKKAVKTAKKVTGKEVPFIMTESKDGKFLIIRKFFPKTGCYNYSKIFEKKEASAAKKELAKLLAK